MALATAVNEANWKLQGGGSNPDGYESTFQRKQADGSFVTKRLAVTFLEVYSEYKHYALTEAACTDYISANPTLALNYNRQDEFGNSFTLSKRLTTRTDFSFTITDVPDGGA